MAVQIRQIHPHFVGEVSGVDISVPLDGTTVAALKAGIDACGVLVFHGQRLTDAQQIEFVKNFGAPERYALSYRNNVKLRLQTPEMVDVSNLSAETGKPETGASRSRMVNLGNRLWHTDSSFRLPAGGLSMLYAHAVPPPSEHGKGDTEFADTRAAYEALPASRRAMLEAMEAEHSLMHSRAMMGFTDFTPEERAALPPVRQPLVRTNPRTGRKALYVASHASHIIGLEVPEGRLLLAELIEHITQPQFVHRHEWRVGDLVIWDNRATLHRGRPFDEDHARDLRRVTTKDETSAQRIAAE